MESCSTSCWRNLTHRLDGYAVSVATGYCFPLPPPSSEWFLTENVYSIVRQIILKITQMHHLHTIMTTHFQNCVICHILPIIHYLFTLSHQLFTFRITVSQTLLYLALTCSTLLHLALLPRGDSFFPFFSFKKVISPHFVTGHSPSSPPSERLI